MNTDGGPAFPVQALASPGSEIAWGMSLRDWFAGQALVGMVSGYFGNLNQTCTGIVNIDPRSIAVAYDIADAMLRARERGQEADGDEAWFAKQPNACVSVSDDVVMASSGRHYLASGSTRAAAIRALRAKVEGGAQ